MGDVPGSSWRRRQRIASGNTWRWLRWCAARTAFFLCPAYCQIFWSRYDTTVVIGGIGRGSARDNLPTRLFFLRSRTLLRFVLALPAVSLARRGLFLFIVRGSRCLFALAMLPCALLPLCSLCFRCAALRLRCAARCVFRCAASALRSGHSANSYPTVILCSCRFANGRVFRLGFKASRASTGSRSRGFTFRNRANTHDWRLRHGRDDFLGYRTTVCAFKGLKAARY